MELKPFDVKEDLCPNPQKLFSFTSELVEEAFGVAGGQCHHRFHRIGTDRRRKEARVGDHQILCSVDRAE